MAICFPGIASSVNRAATSLIRVAPLVITTNCTMTMIVKMMMPTITEDPATKVPKTSITLPAMYMADSGVGESALRISRVDATFRTSRKSVAPSSSAGKTLNSSGRSM